MKPIFTACFCAAWSCAAFAQSPAPAFEVASIKPSAPQAMGQLRVSMGGDPGRVNYTAVTLKDLIVRAYELKPYQVSGPSWMEADRWDVTAKIPDGVKPEQVPAMLRALVEERFHLQSHRETKELPVYEISQGKGGAKLEKAEEGVPGPRIMMEGGERGMQMKVTGATVSNFCDALSRTLDRPVLDKTELTGKFDFTMDLALEDVAGMRGGMVRVGRGGGGESAGPASGPAPEAAPTGSLFTSIQKLGLKLDARKAPIDLLVVDKAEKVPTEN